MTLNYSSLNETRESRYLSLSLYNNPQVMLSTINETLRQKTNDIVEYSDGTVIDVSSNTNLRDGK